MDDIIFTGDDARDIFELKDFLHHHFEMKDLGPLSYFLGLEISSASTGYSLTQAKQLIDNLIYLTVTCPDIAHAVHLVSQFMSAPRSTHYAAILRYVKGTLFHGLHFSSQSSLQLHAYFDADWNRDPTDRRSTTGFYFFLGDSLISWHSKKQTLVARSSTEADRLLLFTLALRLKYRALADTTQEFILLRWLLQDMGVSHSGATVLHWNVPRSIRVPALGLPPYHVFTLEETEDATNNFDPSNLVEEGSWGQQHMTVISKKLRHHHLASVLGHCIVKFHDNPSNTATTIFIILEHVANGSLRDHLKDWKKKEFLKWPQRMGITMGISQGIQFLHTGIAPRVFGNDLKIENILLEDSLCHAPQPGLCGSWARDGRRLARQGQLTFNLCILVKMI
ncbi:leucine-rich repeat protein kinase family protein [Actinidia rufa]|uniref:Leucine-rich repeat protein kinase family protein n=1 Tax=Actinidia rufa TaxID=165716 RepID=A0A7J0D8M8_9ERIC|nr:leucine-rich repeat protein kinase family protein [Actinidia rufa]